MKKEKRHDLEVAEGFLWKIADTIDNGCGTEGWKGKLIPDTIYGADIGPACGIHDYDYHYGYTLADKKIADKRFYRNLRRLVRRSSHGLWIVLLPFKYLRCRTYYLSVAKFGEKAFLADKQGVNNVP